VTDKETKPFVSYYVNTFNRVHLLKNLLDSFEECNEYSGNYEWIITDYGSTDDTRDFLTSYTKNNDFVTLLFGNEDGYVNQLSSLGLKPANNRKKAHAIFGKFRNAARGIARGDIIVEIADDHQFIRKGDWISDSIDILKNRYDIVNKKDVSSIIYRSLSYQRIHKKNNESAPFLDMPLGKEYFVALHKCYDDYHIQEREISDLIGPYLEIDKMNEDCIERWKNGDDRLNHYEDYLARTKALGLKKIFMKYPYVVDFPNDAHNHLNVERAGLIVPIIDNNHFFETFSDLSRPVSSEEIFSISGIL